MFKPENSKQVITLLFNRLNSLHNRVEALVRQLDAEYEDWESKDAYHTWCRRKEMDIVFQKQWCRVKKAIEYALLDPTDAYENSFINEQSFVDDFVARFGKDGDKIVSEYFWDYPVWYTLKDSSF